MKKQNQEERLALIKKHITECQNRKEFEEKFSADLSYLKRYGFRLEFLKQFPRETTKGKSYPKRKEGPRSPLSQEQIRDFKEKAAKCKTKEEFEKSYPWEAKQIRKRSKISLFFEIPKATNWTKNELFIIIRKYKTIKEFSKSHPNAYMAVIRKGFLSECHKILEHAHHDYKSKEFKKWLKKEVRYCKSISKFNKRNSGVYYRIKREYPDLYPIIKTLTINRNVHTSIGEKSLRRYLNKLFSVRFIKTKPKWLINPKTGRRLELDGYCQKINLAFEHNSNYHRNPERDLEKVKQCEERGIILLNFDILTHSRFKTETQVESYIKEILSTHNIKIPQTTTPFKWIWSNSSTKWSYRTLEKISKKYATKSDFKKNDNGAYSTILRRGLKDKLFSHFPVIKKRKSKYSDDFLLKSFFQHLGIGDFLKKNLSYMVLL